MALQAGVQSSKVLILVGAGLTGSIVLRSGRLSELISQLQQLLKGVNDDVHIGSHKLDTAALAAQRHDRIPYTQINLTVDLLNSLMQCDATCCTQIRQLAQEIKELTLSNPVTIFNANSSSNGGLASYLVPAAAVGAMGYCYMWWKGLSFSDVLYVTKHNMASAVANVSGQLDNLSQTLASTRKHLVKKLEILDWKLEEQMETTGLIANDVGEINSKLSNIGFDVDVLQQMLTGLEGKIELLESKQGITSHGIWYLCQFADGFKEGVNSKLGFKDGIDPKLIKDVGAKIFDQSATKYKDNSLKGLQFFSEANESSVTQKSLIGAKKIDDESFLATKSRIHRSRQVGISWALGTS
ncbi:hypothetical protein ACFE04_017009 [Oxalis oulophora]